MQEEQALHAKLVGCMHFYFGVQDGVAAGTVPQCLLCSRGRASPSRWQWSWQKSWVTLASGKLVALERRTCPEPVVGASLQSPVRGGGQSQTGRPFLESPYILSMRSLS